MASIYIVRYLPFGLENRSSLQKSFRVFIPIKISEAHSVEEPHRVRRARTTSGPYVSRFVMRYGNISSSSFSSIVTRAVGNQISVMVFLPTGISHRDPSINSKTVRFLSTRRMLFSTAMNSVPFRVSRRFFRLIFKCRGISQSIMEKKIDSRNDIAASVFSLLVHNQFNVQFWNIIEH
jgi:hypothetical protein